ncbi:MAG: hypothetical protein QOI02_1787, partial [Actinomycetota bacterium]|nr:hypothetical protein [Actinomycetota bacterium]
DTSHGTCAHTASSACAYVYGYSIAHDDVTMPTTALPSGLHWWLDVETSNTWQSDTHANASVLAGMKAYFTSIGDTVGIYSTSYQWKTIVGATSSSSSLAGIPTWLAGASSNTAAAAACANSPLTPGDRVSMVQFVVNNLDRNYSCHQFADAPAPVMSVSGSFGVGKKLTAVPGTWTVNPTSFSYQWLRSGLAISNATKSTYTATSTDGGKQLSVKVTATRRGYTTLAQKSAQVLILKTLTATPVPKITGTAKVGVTLTASAGTWSPSPVTLSYQWNRDGVAISTNATGKTYVPVAGDVGKAITVTVTGSRSGYMSVHHSSPSVTPKA